MYAASESMPEAADTGRSEEETESKHHLLQRVFKFLYKAVEAFLNISYGYLNSKKDILV